jgi:hypothetical protein
VGKEEILRGILRIRKIDQWLRTFFEHPEKDIILDFDGRINQYGFRHLFDDTGQLILLD